MGQHDSLTGDKGISRRLILAILSSSAFWILLSVQETYVIWTARARIRTMGSPGCATARIPGRNCDDNVASLGVNCKSGYRYTFLTTDS